MVILRRGLMLVAIAYAGGAAAQTTSTTMEMGGGMTHVDTVGPNGAMSSSNCMNVGGGMTSCQTMDMSQPQRSSPTPDMSQPRAGGTSTLGLIAGAIARSNERSFQKKIGHLISQGDCNGAAKLAYSKGRIELGNQVRARCDRSEGAIVSAPTSSTSPSDLVARLHLFAARANSAVPAPLDDITTATKIEAVGTQILINARVNSAEATLTDSIRSNVKDQICANPSSPELLKAGASIRIKYADSVGQDLGSVMVTRAECGL
jgi:hypothetical protein